LKDSDAILDCITAPHFGLEPYSSHVSSGVGDVFRRVVTPTADGWWDITSVRLEPNFQDLRSPYLCNGDKRVAVSIGELGRAARYLPLLYPEHSHIISCIALMHEAWVQVFWKRSSICLFESVEGRHLEVLRVIGDSMSTSEQRDGIHVSFSDTILSLSELYRCQGEHKRS
jgi:hypothetical protein